eukprot:gene1137-673_t
MRRVVISGWLFDLVSSQSTRQILSSLLGDMKRMPNNIGDGSVLNAAGVTDVEKKVFATDTNVEIGRENSIQTLTNPMASDAFLTECATFEKMGAHSGNQGSPVRAKYLVGLDEDSDGLKALENACHNVIIGEGESCAFNLVTDPTAPSGTSKRVPSSTKWRTRRSWALLATDIGMTEYSGTVETPAMSSSLIQLQMEGIKKKPATTQTKTDRMDWNLNKCEANLPENNPNGIPFGPEIQNPDGSKGLLSWRQQLDLDKGKNEDSALATPCSTSLKPEMSCMRVHLINVLALVKGNQKMSRWLKNAGAVNAHQKGGGKADFGGKGHTMGNRSKGSLEENTTVSSLLDTVATAARRYSLITKYIDPSPSVHHHPAFIQLPGGGGGLADHEAGADNQHLEIHGKALELPPSAKKCIKDGDLTLSDVNIMEDTNAYQSDHAMESELGARYDTAMRCVLKSAFHLLWMEPDSQPDAQSVCAIVNTIDTATSDLKACMVTIGDAREITDLEGCPCRKENLGGMAVKEQVMEDGCGVVLGFKSEISDSASFKSWDPITRIFSLAGILPFMVKCAETMALQTSAATPATQGVLAIGAGGVNSLSSVYDANDDMTSGTLEATTQGKAEVEQGKLTAAIAERCGNEGAQEISSLPGHKAEADAQTAGVSAAEGKLCNTENAQSAGKWAQQMLSSLNSLKHQVSGDAALGRAYAR